jgi:PmbA protein
MSETKASLPPAETFDRAASALDRDPAAQITRLKEIVTQVLAQAQQLGASAAEATVDVSQGLSVTVRLGEVETVEHTRDKGIAVTVYFGHRSGSASSTDLSPAALAETVRAACTIARYTAEDEAAGLAEPEWLAREIPDLDLYHPWPITVEEAIERARAAEAAARAEDARITNSEGATLSSHEGVSVYGNTHGFLAGYPASRHSLSVSVIGQDMSGMQRDYWYTVARAPGELESPEAVGRRAAARAVRRLAARKLATCRCPVLFEAPVAASLIAHFVSAVRGSSLYRRASFLLDALGKPVFAPFVRLHEQPHLPRALGSAPYDNEGVATRARDLVRGGVLEGYVLDAYSARKLGMVSTGNAGGVHNLTLEPGPPGELADLAGLLKKMGTGLLVTELIGFGVNTVTGDYSRGAAGFWVENGEIAYPVEEITVAGNLRDMFRGMVAAGTDVDVRGSLRTGSILIESMTVAGK